MKVILFGATGMVGQGVLRECLLDPEVERVLAVGRKATGQQHEKLRELVHKDFADFSSVEDALTGYDACFFCLGVSSAGMKEEDYHRVTYDFTLAAARTLVKLNPGMTFIYVSGTGTDSTEQGRSMWARVKGKTENALMKLPFKASYMFRPGIIQPMDGIQSQTKVYRVGYAVMRPLTPVLKALFPKLMTDTRQVGRAMLHAARHGAPKRLLENPDINSLAGGAS
ncbi:NAD(P)H-binding protein [Corallococcus llansteffanensis]|uniref:NAD-dependent epimerase/dehydratase family protein n=1 Tax=Corallococcus llansteffanensis TaxID=2316731 RepID=A0A3A8P5A8_9BACT|nr:NAD(P)H-binding protein [Corallococcus llansteffanensis]RKH51657.1 NAD-dependent epimerase/dehydratase family protein [Corallococcus llansteffanensis]